MSSVDHGFRAMGCELRVAATAADRSAAELSASALRIERFVGAASARLTRFDSQSELRRAEGVTVVSSFLRQAVAVSLRTARASDGLLDPTLGTAVEGVGYDATFDHARRADLRALLDAAPPRQPARGRPDAVWQQIAIDEEQGTITLPRGTRLDLGATAKGLLADLALRLLGPVDQAFVDAGGDLALSATTATAALAADPFGRAPATLTLAGGTSGLATSSIAERCWWRADGEPAHHLLDPSTGRPAFTGVVQVTAAAPSTTEAERRAGQALLSGPSAARELLSPYGGLVVLDDATTLRIEGVLLR